MAEIQLDVSLPPILMALLLMGEISFSGNIDPIYAVMAII